MLTQFVGWNRNKEGRKRVSIRFYLLSRNSPLDMIPYSFGGESVKEKAIVAFPLSMAMLFGRSRSLCVLMLSDFDEKTISGWITFVVVSLTRDAAKWTIIEAGQNVNGARDLQNINLMCYIHANEKSFYGKSVSNMIFMWNGKRCWKHVLLTFFWFSNNHLLWRCCWQWNFWGKVFIFKSILELFQASP